MKRKGLIVSSIVMVIVLIASLTTATYAWFSSTSSAKIENMTIRTVAGKGLSIGAYQYNNSTGADALSSGELIPSATFDRFVGTDPGSKDILKFTYTPDVSTGFYAASGNGLPDEMWSAYGAVLDNDQTNEDPNDDTYVFTEAGPSMLDSSNKPSYMARATTKSYFATDFCVINNDIDTSKLTLVMDNISIEPVAGNDVIEVASSLRIAIFGLDATAEIAKTPIPWKIDNLLYVFEPFANQYLDDTTKKMVDTAGEISVKNNPIDTFVNGTAPEVGTDPITIAASKIKTYATGTHAGVFTPNANGRDRLIRLAQPSTKGFTAYTQADIKTYVGALDTKANPKAPFYSTISDNEGLILKNFASGKKVIPLRLVIWFEGEDSECITSFAQGGGINFSCGFSAVKNCTDPHVSAT